MKRTFLFLLAAVLLGAGGWSCGREDNNGDNGSDTTSLQWVDLGLPSGLLWADRNVGAKSVEDYGNYYAWGESAPKEVYDWSTYAYSDAEGYLTKYCNKTNYGLNGFTDKLTTLEDSDDAATVNIGGKARMPRDFEWQELEDKTTSTWTTRNGVYGRLFTAYNGKSIFLPAAGRRFGSSLYYAGEDGLYWSSTLDLSNLGSAWYCYCSSGYHGVNLSGYRYNGFSVRAVRDSQN